MVTLRSRQISLIGLLLLPAAPAVASADDHRLVSAVRQQDMVRTRALLRERLDVNDAQADGSTALAWATHWNDLDIVNALLRAGAGSTRKRLRGHPALARLHQRKRTDRGPTPGGRGEPELRAVER